MTDEDLVRLIRALSAEEQKKVYILILAMQKNKK